MRRLILGSKSKPSDGMESTGRLGDAREIDGALVHLVCGILCFQAKAKAMIILNNLSSPGSILSLMKDGGPIPTVHHHLSFLPPEN